MVTCAGCGPLLCTVTVTTLECPTVTFGVGVVTRLVRSANPVNRIGTVMVLFDGS